MKIRNGFVSNSSTSSFLIYGICIEEDGELNYDDIYDIAEKNNLRCYHLYDSFYIGKSWSKVKDNQTGLQFKESITEKIKKAFPDYKGKLETFEQAWDNH